MYTHVKPAYISIMPGMLRFRVKSRAGVLNDVSDT